METLPKVLVVGGDYLVHNMFQLAGYRTTDELTGDVGLVVFTGGADVSPELYGETAMPHTQCTPKRDRFEAELYEALVEEMIPCVGICRGGQLLNVLNGGKMWQDVNNHTHQHELLDKITNRHHVVTSTHHQMMRPRVTEKGDNGAPIIVAVANMSTFKESQNGAWRSPINDWEDIEVVYYPATRTLCFQPHPEYNVASCRSYFFELLVRYGLNKEPI